MSNRQVPTFECTYQSFYQHDELLGGKASKFPWKNFLISYYLRKNEKKKRNNDAQTFGNGANDTTGGTQLSNKKYWEKNAVFRCI